MNGIWIDTWTDSDFANDKKDRKSITGYVTKINNQVICSKSIKQSVIASSTTHAEVIAASTAARDLIWTQQLFEECELNPEIGKLIIDNHGAERLCNNPGNHNRSKHFQINQLIVREYVNNGKCETYLVDTTENIADGNTKPLGETTFCRFRTNMGIVDVEQLLKDENVLVKEYPVLKKFYW